MRRQYDRPARASAAAGPAPTAPPRVAAGAADIGHGFCLLLPAVLAGRFVTRQSGDGLGGTPVGTGNVLLEPGLLDPPDPPATDPDRRQLPRTDQSVGLGP